MSSSALQYDHAYASYMLQCRRFFERLEAFKVKNVSSIMVRIIRCFSKEPEDAFNKIPTYVHNLIQDGQHEQALVETISHYASFTVDRTNLYNFIFVDKKTGSSSDEISSDADGFVLALCSAYIRWRLDEFSIGRNLSHHELTRPVELLHE